MVGEINSTCISSTCSLASIFCKLLAALSNWWNWCPDNLPWIVLMLPSPFRWAQYFHLTSCCLAPDAACLVRSTLYVIFQSSIGWGYCIIWLLLVGMSSLTLSISVAELDLPYIMMTNRSRTFFSLSPKTGGYILSFANTSKASGYTSHVCHVILLPFPRKAETTSQQVKAWKKGIRFDFTEPIECLMSCKGIHRKFDLWPKATHNFSRPLSFSIWNTLIAMTRTSVSLALIIREIFPCFTACLACRKSRESASSW